MAAFVFLLTVGKAFISVPGVWEAANHQIRQLRVQPFGSFVHYRVWWGPWLNFFGNIALFVPVGWLARRVVFSTWRVVAFGAGVSLCIEVAQYVLAAGYSDIDDVMFNTLGAYCGARLCVMSERGWWTSKVFPDGHEPDPRFTLANERTFLAWTRTALAFLAGGIALGALNVEGIDPQMRTVAAVAVIVIGMAIAAGAAFRWVRVERALRHDRPLPAPGIVPVLCVGIFVASVVALVGIV